MKPRPVTFSPKKLTLKSPEPPPRHDDKKLRLSHQFLIRFRLRITELARRHGLDDSLDRETGVIERCRNLGEGAAKEFHLADPVPMIHDVLRREIIPGSEQFCISRRMMRGEDEPAVWSEYSPHLSQ